jgi:hypothetical protein
MNIRVIVHVPLSRENAFTLFRDRLHTLEERSPNARIVGAAERRDLGKYLHVKNKWRGGATLPAAVRGIITTTMVAWTSESIWDPRSLICDWRIVPDALLPQALGCQGRTAFLPGDGDHAVIQVTGSVVADAKKLPGVPSFLAPMVGRTVEDFLVAQIESNLHALAAAASAQVEQVG